MTTTVAPSAIGAEIDQLTAELLAAVRSYRDAKARFRRYDGMNTVRMPQPDSGRAYQGRANAIGDCSWLQSDIQTLAAALTALCVAEQEEIR